MSDREWQIGIVGTFDVENYGDLLFPLIAEAELRARLGPTRLHRFSYGAKSGFAWPYDVTSIADFPSAVSALDGLLVGGGFLLRFDKGVANGYVPPLPEMHHPTAYWLTPALVALQHDVPVIWNSPGALANDPALFGRWSDDVPAWAEPLVAFAFSRSRYVAVRDARTRDGLARTVDSERIEVVPDTAFGIASLLDADTMCEADRLRAACGLGGPYVVVQPTPGLERLGRFLTANAARLGGLKVLALPIGPIHGDDPAVFDEVAPGLARLPSWPGPLAIAALIGGAEAALGGSYHLAITALAQGVPVFTPRPRAEGRLAAMDGFERLYSVGPDCEPDVDWFLERIGRGAPSPPALVARERLVAHWDRAADAVRAGRVPTGVDADRFWMALPRLLETGEARRDEAVAAAAAERETLLRQVRAQAAKIDRLKASGAAQRARTDELARLVRLGRAEIAARDEPEARSTTTIDLTKIARYSLRTDPYMWAEIGGLYSCDDAAALAATFPRDHFKTLAYYGEREWEYDARALIPMGEACVSRPEALSESWARLARELLSPEYRAAVSLLTERDLTGAWLEVSVFHYGPGASLSPHQDLDEKLVTHVLYFNETWDRMNGGCLTVLRSADPDDVAAVVEPVVGNSAVIVRSERSWHAVSRVIDGCHASRRSLTATFYRPGSTSTLWRPEDTTPLHTYGEPE